MHIECGNTQFRRPTGDEGRLLLEDMNRHHYDLSVWALSKLSVNDDKKILDIGCGGGMFISLLSERYKNAEIWGVDISEVSVSLTMEKNISLVNDGRLHVSLNSVSELPFGDGTFDLVTAVETYFFWPEIEKDVPKAASKVNKGGQIMIVSEAYPHPLFKERNDEGRRECGLDLRENAEMKKMLEECGMNVTVHTVEEKNWVAFVGKRG